MAITHAVVSTGEKAVFVPIAPCRLFDLRPAPDQVGPRATPLNQGETYTQVVWGANGNCTIPTDATAVAMNVTAVGGTAGSFLTIWPSDVAPKPTASNLNWVPGSPPTPNKVDVKLSADGKINLFNLAGTVSVIADVVGYYADHNHDDRYYTKAQIDATLSSNVVIRQGLEFVPNGTAPGTLQHFTNLVTMSSPSGAQTALVGPKTQNGVTFGLVSINYCINTPLAPAIVTQVAVAGSPVTKLAIDNTDRTTSGCFDLVVNDGVSTSFSLFISVTGAGGSVSVTSLTSTWAPVGLIPASASSASAATSGGGIVP